MYIYIYIYILSYRFLAKIDHTVGEGNVVTTPGAEHEKALNATGVDYHSCASGCDHCGFERKRSNTYIVQHDDGSTLQVGSSCIDDYIGEGTLASVMTAFDIHAFIINTDEFDEMALGVARDTLREQTDIAFYLALAAEQISLTGFVPARGEVPTYILLQNLLNKLIHGCYYKLFSITYTYATSLCYCFNELYWFCNYSIIN